MSNSNAIRLSRQTLGVLEVLLAEPGRPTYGFELMEQAGIKSGTLYPILARLERQGFLESEWEEGNLEGLGRPRRRFYVLTPEGRALSADALREREGRARTNKRRSGPIASAPNVAFEIGEAR